MKCVLQTRLPLMLEFSTVYNCACNKVVVTITSAAGYQCPVEGCGVVCGKWSELRSHARTHPKGQMLRVGSVSDIHGVDIAGSFY